MLHLSSSNKMLISLFVVFVVASYAVWHMFGPVISSKRLNRLTIGMNKAAVKAVIGEPSRIVDDNVWQYEKRGNLGWVAIHFDGDSQLVLVNDESVFPHCGETN